MLIMKQYVKCKACGYIMEASKVRAVCPACGVPAKLFEPYEERIDEKRKRLLDLHIHPIVVHLPQAFAVTLVALSAGLAILADGSLRTILYNSTQVLAILLPLAVAAAFAAGALDGKTRFRKLTTPLLIRKMVIGAIFFATSLAAAALALFTPLISPAIAPFALLELLSLFCAIRLGYMGFGLLSSRFPG
jgi:rubredoxin